MWQLGTRLAVSGLLMCGLSAAFAQEPAPPPADGSGDEQPVDAPMDPGGGSVETMDAPDASTEEAASDGYRTDLREVEERVHDLKEKVFQSKATLELLRELVIEGASMGARIRIQHVDELARAYKIERIEYFLDGKSVYAWTAPPDGSEPPDAIDIRDQSISPGEHALQVSLVVVGNEKVIGYLDAYRVTVESSYAFEVDGGTVTDLVVKAVSKGGVRKRFVERPTVVYEERREQLKVE